ncbi:single-stranded-DNA-specific exonuclease RecJ [Pelagibacteraceae bacterium]|nr:single-stranded-DNA-specific exonuclease RecJ [Pelagibacteraceae bacterium]MDC0366261.1 single-stranded-DNA-specific exonuclease RecJ [Pelagibacteraceae bacterium]
MNSLSVSGKNWILKKFNQADILFFKENFLLDEITAKLLSIRDIQKKDVNSFLNPSIKNFLPNPNVLLDMEKSSLRTIESIKNNDKIGIFGDYDVDGATSTALLGKYFDHLDVAYKTYIPDRKTEGYGPSIKGFKELIDYGVKIIFTVDCGTLSFDAIEYAKNKKIDVIILDHHQSEINLPKAYSIVNPNRIDDKSNLQYLCAVGVSFMFLVSLNKSLRSIQWFEKKNKSEPNLLNYLDLVSLGTVCDVVPLVGLNRALVKQGLKILRFKKNLGLKTLLDICKIESNPSIYHLGFVLGPRINAGGRVGKCSHGANLLLNKNPKETFKLAIELNQFNKERQMLEKDLLEKILVESKNYSNDPVIILEGNNWHEGVIGIVAARLKDKFNKPTIIISINNKLGKASARSIVGFDIGSVILAATQEKILIKGGGHKMAGGFSIEVSNIKKFKEFVFNKYRGINIDLSVEKPLLIDCKIAPSAVNLDFYEKVNILSPFGSGNPEPKFYIEDLKPVNSKVVGERHIKSVLIGPEGSSIKTIAFNAVDNELGAYLLKKKSSIFNIAGKLSLNEWRGQKNVEFIIDDISVNKNHKNKVPSSIG